MDAKKQEKKNFFKKNIYYFVVAFILIGAITATIVLMVTGGKTHDITIDSSKDDSHIDENQDLENPGGGENGNEDSNTDAETDENDDKPVEVVVSFILPVDDATILCDYTATSLVYNKTLNIYTGHMAIDFSAPMGAKVKAVYGGVVESVETSYLKGTTVVINHGNDLKTVYNSIDIDENMVKGRKIEQGEIVGTVSDNNKQEYKDGPHLHFEVIEKGEKISPYKYLKVSEK